MNLGGNCWIVAYEVATAPRDPSGELEVITSKILQLPSWCGLLTITAYLCHRWPQMFRCGCLNPAILSSFVIMTGFVTITTRLVPLVEQELLTVLEFISVFNLVRVVHFLGYFYLSCIIVCGAQHDFHFTWCWCLLSITRQVSLVEQELLIFPEHRLSVGFVLFIR